jgi:predicted kinase
MSRLVVLVTGVPGSGKSTLGRAVARELGLPLISVDVIKEALFRTLGVDDRAWSLQVRAAALGVVFSLLPDCAAGAVIDVWIDPARDQQTFREAFASAVGEGDVIREILCEVPGDVAASRYAGRDRDPGHLPADDATLSRIRAAAALISPLGIAPALRVDTSREVGFDEITGWLRQQ